MRPLLLLLVLGIAPAAHAQPSAAAFVQRLYSSYVAAPSSAAALARHPALSPALRRGFAREAACLRTSDGYCYLEADPLLHSQDPCPRYTAGRTVVRGAVTRVFVQGDCGQAVWVDVRRAGRSWQVVDVWDEAREASLLAGLSGPRL